MLGLVSRVLTSFFSLIWTPLLLGAMGKELNGLFLNFQGMATLGGLGDLGVGGAVNIQVARLLGQKKETELHSFMAAARGGILLIALFTGIVYLAVSPGAFNKLHFKDSLTVGPLIPLALVGAFASVILILNGFVSNINQGCGNVAWLVLPSFLAVQIGCCGHWLLARQGAPLWLQYTPYVAASLIVLALGPLFVRASQPQLARVFPISLHEKEVFSVASKSGWYYLYSIATGISLTASRFLITSGFGAERVPSYLYNSRLCELAMFVMISASFASMPKITQWLAGASRERAVDEITLLNRMQACLACAAVLVYLLVNDWFIRLWLGKDFHESLLVQAAFAANMGVTAAGLTGFDLAPRCCDKGIRVGGITAVLCALLNLALAWTAMKLGWIPGIALAAVISQSAVVLGLGWYSSRQLNMSWWNLSVKHWILVLTVVAIGYGARSSFALGPLPAVLITCGSIAGALVLVVKVVGLGMHDVKREIGIFKAIAGKFGSKT